MLISVCLFELSCNLRLKQYVSVTCAKVYFLKSENYFTTNLICFLLTQKLKILQNPREY